MIDVFAFIIGLAIAFQLITAMLLFILGKNTPFVFLVNKLYEEEPKGIYDRFMNGFYYMFFGIAVVLFRRSTEKHGGIKGRFIFLLEWIGITVMLFILVNIPHMF
ncbi:MULTISPECIES: hypothetical protein [Bacillaceae]|uniref:Uncharacterized protein n=1 Tax=Alkalicoccobacillus plakortidis TaxID=444060 RepID=A0A9D5DVN6_9BACI|nr:MULTISPECIES: hypothetical protein [Bacillaceae]KQL58936.1 hypothetical protein AN965_00605 [Alkalicoccobacillus plakortidis]